MWGAWRGGEAPKVPARPDGPRLPRDGRPWPALTRQRIGRRLHMDCAGPVAGRNWGVCEWAGWGEVPSMMQTPPARPGHSPMSREGQTIQ